MLELISALPLLTITYCLITAVLLDGAIVAHLIGTGTLSGLLRRAGVDTFDDLLALPPETLDRVRAVRAPALVLAAVSLVVAVVTAVLHAPGATQ